MRKKAYILLIIAIAIITTIIVGMFFLMRKYESTVLAGANIAGVDAGGKNIDDAMTQIEAELSIFLEKKVVILASDQVAEFLPADLGIGFDYEKTKNSLPTMRSLSGILRGVYLFVSGQEIVPSVVIDEEKLFSTISILNLEFDAQNAYLSLDPVSKEVILNAESSGIKMDRESFQQDLNKKFEDLSEDSITINLFEIEPAIISADIEPFMDQAGDILTKKITISYDSDEWIFSASDYSYLLSFGTKSTFAEDFGITWSDGEQNENAKENSLVETGIDVVIDEGGLGKYVQDFIATEVESPAENVSITMDDAGVITFEGSAKDGIEVNTEVLKDMIELSLESGVDAIDLPVKTLSSEVNVSQNLADLGIKELISVGYTDFTGSPYNRILNVGVGLSKFNGLLVEPGETFSFLDNLGAVDAASGYYKELVITNNETKPEYGGGLCQVSSTMYRAVLYGGLPVVARTEHSYAVSYYAYPSGYGLDATIYQPAPDLKFTNDTGSYILIQSYSEGTSAYFKFYGTDDGRTVMMDGPYYSNRVGAPADIIVYTTELAAGETQKKDSAHNGFDATWYRTIIGSDGTEETETIFSHYQAWPAKYLVGIAEGESGSGTTVQ